MKLTALLERRSAPWLVLAIALVLGLATLQIGFYNDDYEILAALNGSWRHGPRPWDLYRFAYGSVEANGAEIESGALPWWTTPFLKLHLVRPLASLTFVLDAKIFGMSSSIGWHLHSIAWYLLLVHAVGAVLRAVFPRGTATLAMLVYAMSTAHLYPYGWIACRHMVIAAALGLLGLSYLVRGHRHGPWVFALGLAGALASSEAAVAVAAFGIAWMLAQARRDSLPQRARVRALLLRLVPTVGVLLVWLAAYVAVDGGAAHSDGYVDPTSAPVRFATKAATMLPILIANATFGVPAEIVSVGVVAPLVVLGILAIAFVAAMWRGSAAAMADEERSSLPWLVAAAVVGLVPSLGGFPGARVLLVPNLGFAALIAVLVRRGFAKTRDARTAGRVARSAGAGLLVLVHLVAAPLIDAGNASFNARIGRRLESVAASADAMTGPEGRVRLFVVGASDPMVTMYPPIVLVATSAKHYADNGCWSVLSASRQAHAMTRTAADTIVLRPLSGPLLRGPFESLFRSTSDPMRVGDEVRQCHATLRVTAAPNGQPTEVEVRFDVPLEDPSLAIVRWNGERLEPLRLPRVGETVEIPWSAGPLTMF